MRTKLILSVLLFLLVFPQNVIGIDSSEVRYGFFSDWLVVSGNTIIFNEIVNKKIVEIGSKVAQASGGPTDLKFTFRVINDPAINAFAAAGGFIYLCTGLLDILESEDELAVILGHEIAHINQSHQVKKFYEIEKAQQRAQTAGMIISYVAGVAGQAAGIAVSSAASSAASASTSAMFRSNLAQWATSTSIQLIGGTAANAMILSVVYGFGKEKELEADALAIRYTKKAGYDPNALINVLKRLASTRDRLKFAEQQYASSLINAEPGLEERIKTAEKLILNAK